MSIVKRKIKMIKEINPSLDGVNIIVRNNRVIGEIPIVDRRLERIVFGLDDQTDSNFDFVRRLAERMLGGRRSATKTMFGYLVTDVIFIPDLAYQFREIRSFYDLEDNFVKFTGTSYGTIVHAKDIMELVRNDCFVEADELIRPLDDSSTNIFIHSITHIPPDGLSELMMRKATIHLVINEWVLDKIIERTWG